MLNQPGSKVKIKNYANQDGLLFVCKQTYKQEGRPGLGVTYGGHRLAAPEPSWGGVSPAGGLRTHYGKMQLGFVIDCAKYV